MQLMLERGVLQHAGPYPIVLTDVDASSMELMVDGRVLRFPSTTGEFTLDEQPCSLRRIDRKVEVTLPHLQEILAEAAS